MIDQELLDLRFLDPKAELGVGQVVGLVSTRDGPAVMVQYQNADEDGSPILIRERPDVGFLPTPVVEPEDSSILRM
jgi:hypothetical protein